MRALVTGGNGFVAQWAMRSMLDRGWTVTAAGIGALPSSVVLTDAERSQIEWRSMDITQQRDVAAAVDSVCPDVVLHLAAVSHVPE